MATNLNISENQERISLGVRNNELNRTVTVNNGSPYYVGARAYVTQRENGATITVIDKDGTTTATVDDGFSPSASVSKSGNDTTITVTDKSGTTATHVYDGAGVQLVRW